MSDYWERRKAQQMFEYMAGAEERADSISRLYLQASRYFSGQMDKIFERYRKQNGLSEADARRFLNQIKTPGDIDELKQLLRQATEGGDSEKRKQLLTELEAPAYRARLERLQRMYGNLDQVMQNIYKQEQIEHEAWYLELAADAYYHSVYDLQKQTGLAYSFGYTSPKMIERVINSRWSGANYSERIWGNTQKLADDLKQELLLSLVTGRTDREAAEVFAQRFAVGASYARRLIRTESCHLCTQMDMLSYEDAEIEFYRYLATLDLRTSKICRELDGKVFRVADQQTGVNAPPMHPWCRSTTTAALSDEDLARLTRRAIDPVTGKEIHVPASMNYREWYAKYITEQSENYEKGISGARINRIGNNQVDLDFINSDEFRKKFNKITNNTAVNNSLRNYSMAILTHRNSTDGEDLYIIDSDGKLVLRKISGKNELGVALSAEESKLLRTQTGIIGIHNHPTNILPTGSDFAAAGYRKYRFGMVVTHDGRVFKYGVGNKPFLPTVLDARIDKYTSSPYNLSEEKAHVKALNEMVKEYDITWEELK